MTINFKYYFFSIDIIFLGSSYLIFDNFSFFENTSILFNLIDKSFAINIKINFKFIIYFILKEY